MMIEGTRTKEALIENKPELTPTEQPTPLTHLDNDHRLDLVESNYANKKMMSTFNKQYSSEQLNH